MPASNVAAEKRSQPQILVETAGLSEEEWLAYRRKGIGGSDVAALLGSSPVSYTHLRAGHASGRVWSADAGSRRAGQ